MLVKQPSVCNLMQLEVDIVTHSTLWCKGCTASQDTAAPADRKAPGPFVPLNCPALPQARSANCAIAPNHSQSHPAPPAAGCPRALHMLCVLRSVAGGLHRLEVDLLGHTVGRDPETEEHSLYHILRGHCALACGCTALGGGLGWVYTCMWCGVFKRSI